MTFTSLTAADPASWYDQAMVATAINAPGSTKAINVVVITS